MISQGTKFQLQAIGLALLVWLFGFALMEFPLGDPLLRAGYDWLHLLTSHPPMSKVLVIAMNENTDAKLGRKQGMPFSRLDHARLLQRLAKAGGVQVCYDILFDQPSADPKVDEQFSQAVKEEGDVILGWAEETTRGGLGTQINEPILPTSKLRDAAAGVGLLNAGPRDPDGVVRRFDAGTKLQPSLELAEARAQNDQMNIPTEPLWLNYVGRPGEIPTLEFADCLDKEKVPDSALKGRTVFIGGEYVTNVQGTADTYPTPYTRFGAPAIYGVDLHATAFVNLRDGLWLQSAGWVQNLMWCLPLALPVALVPRIKFWNKRKAMIIGAWAGYALVVTAAAIVISWESRVMLNWPALALVQAPLSLVGLWLQKPPEEVPAVQFFISSVTKEFGSYRDALRRHLERPNVNVKIQEDFIASGRGTLPKLDEYIRACDCVIHLAGDMTGAMAMELDVAELLMMHPDLLERLPVLKAAPAGIVPLSYTQWEAYLAAYHGKLLMVAAPTAEAQRDPTSLVDPAQQESQKAHLQRLELLRHYTEIRFRNADDLSAQVLKSKLHDFLGKVAAAG